MTTLPQPASLRLPRPSAGGAITIPGVPSTGPGNFAPPQGIQMTGADMWRVIRSNLWLIVLMVVVASGVGYGANYWLKLSHSRFTSAGLLRQIMPTAEDGSPQQNINPSGLFVELKSHAALLKDPSLLNTVLQNPDSAIRQTSWFRSHPDPMEAKADLAENFEVTIPGDSSLLRLSMTNSDPKSCQAIVQTIGDEYIKEQQEISRDREYGRNRDLENRKAVEDNNLKVVNGDIAELESELNSNGVTGTQNRINSKDMELTKLVDNQILLRLSGASLQEEYKRITDTINSDQDPPQVAALIYSDPQVAAYRNLVNSLELAISDALDHYLPDHPSVVALQKRKTAMEDKLNATVADARVRYRTQVVEDAKARLTDAQRSIDETNKSIESLRGDMAHLTDLMSQLLRQQEFKAAYEARLKTIDEQLDQLANYSVRRDLNGVQWAAHPEIPDLPSFPKLPVTMTISITLGLALALGVAFLRELMDTSIRSPRDLSRVGNLNLLGMVPHENDDPQSAGARLPVVIFEAPHSMMAEQLRQVRTRLQHTASLDSTRSILVTSPSPGDGKSTIAANLASGLALNGRRILLVDANFRRPELHRIFNVGNEVGFSDVLNKLDLFETTVHETQVPNLYVLPSGLKPSNATELLESQLLIDFIDRALEVFDHVVFDSGPLLFVSETVALAPRVDGVVTVVRARANTRGVLTRMRDSLRQIKAEHLGVVLNAVRALGGGYYGRNIRTYYEYRSDDEAA
jgi:capsular exopolysaccharide synthesis family protein